MMNIWFAVIIKVVGEGENPDRRGKRKCQFNVFI